MVNERYDLINTGDLLPSRLLSNGRCNPEQMRGTLALWGGEEVRLHGELNKAFSAKTIKANRRGNL